MNFPRRLRKKEIQDLGFGNNLSQNQDRIISDDGSFNIQRKGLQHFSIANIYHYLITISWSKFFFLTTVTFLIANIFFGGVYAFIGEEALSFPPDKDLENPFLRGFFFSVQTITTIGFGHIAPIGLTANTIVTFESMIGLFAQALGTGLLFARFSRPTAKIRFSKNAIIAPFQNGKALMFRIVNLNHNELIEMQAKLLFTYTEKKNGKTKRGYYGLNLERSKIAFFPMAWTIVHPIDEKSPLWEKTEKELEEMNAEFLVLLTGTEETFAQMVHSRNSYKFNEVKWNVKFANVMEKDEFGNVFVDVNKLHKTEKVL